MTEHTRPENAGRPRRAEIEEIRSLRSRLAKLERGRVECSQTDEVYRSLVANAPQGLLILLKGQVIFANEAMADLTGYSIDEMKTATRQQVQAFVHPEDCELVWGRHRDRLAGKPTPKHYEFRGIRKDGNTCWLEVHVRAIEYCGEHAVQAAFTDITERKKVELGLRQSNDLLRAIVEAAPTAIIGLDLDGNVHTVWNHAAEKMLGWTAQEAMGRPLPSVPAAGQEEFKGFRERIRRGLTLDGVEVRRQRKDGTPIDYSIYASPLHDPEGKITGNVAVLVEVTERKRMEAALRESERKLEEAQRIAHVGHWEHDLCVDCITGSDETLRIFGVAPEERKLCFSRFLELVHADDREMVAQTVAEALRGSKSFDLEYRVVRPRGEVRFVHVQCNVTREESGRPSHLFGIVQDITERKQAAEALRQSEQKYRRIVDTATEGIWVLGPDTRTTFVNARMAEMLGVSYEEAIGRTLTDFMYEEDVPDHLRKMQNRRDGVSENYERRFRRKDGRAVWTLVSATPVFDDEHHFQGSFGMFTDITDRKRAEEELRRSEDRYRVVADNTYDWEFWKGADGRFLYSSPSCRRITGHAADDFTRDPDLLNRLVHPEDRERFLLHCSHVMDRRTPGEMEYRIVLADGSVRHIGHVCQPVFDERGEYLGIRGSNRDITKHKRWEAALLESERRFRDLYENAPNAYFSVGTNGFILACNRRAGELLGYSAEELVGRSVIDLYADTVHGKEKARKVLERFQVGQPTYDEELQMQKADGDRVWISLTVDAVRDAQGQILGSRSMVVDITDRKRAERVRNARLHLLQFAAAHSLDELLQATLDELELLTGSQIGFYHFLEADQQTLSLQTWSTRTLRGMCTAEGKGRHYSVSEAGVWVDCIRERRPVIHNDYASLPHRKGMPPGHATVVRELVVPVFRGDRIVSILGVGNKPKDYTEGDVEIVSSLADLAWDIADRKRAEQQAQERQAELLHVSRLTTLGEMASGLAHELSQPLSAILNYASAGARRVTSGGADMNGIALSLETIVDQAKRAGNILGRIRALAQRRPPRFASVDMNGVVKDVIDLISWEARRKEVGIKLELAEGLPSIWADTTQMEQVVLNLARNAIEAMSTVEQRPRLLTVRTSADGRGQVQIEVCDTGMGLPEGDAKRMFEPFFTTKNNGLGVGLSISRTIVEMHNGTLEAKPNTDCGSTFVLALPVTQPETS